MKAVRYGTRTQRDDTSTAADCEMVAFIPQDHKELSNQIEESSATSVDPYDSSDDHHGECQQKMKSPWSRRRLFLAVLALALSITGICFLTTSGQDNFPGGGGDTEALPNSIFGKPFIVMQEGGCAGTTAIGGYIRRIVRAHQLDFFPQGQEGTFEYLKLTYKARKEKYKNKIAHDIIEKRNMTPEEAQRNEMQILLESVQIAVEKTKKSQQLFFFKGNIKKLHGEWSWLKEKLSAIKGTNFVGIYRENALDRCTCMIRDCFFESREFGNAFFQENGTESELCFDRRNHPEINIAANFTNTIGCLHEDLNRRNAVRDNYLSMSSESLFQHESTFENEAFEASVDQWMIFLKPLMKDVLNSTIVAQVLQEKKGAYANSHSSQSTKIYNYEQVKIDLKDTEFEHFLDGSM